MPRFILLRALESVLIIITIMTHGATKMASTAVCRRRLAEFTGCGDKSFIMS